MCGFSRIHLNYMHKEIRTMTGFQKFLMVVSICASLLLGYICYDLDDSHQRLKAENENLKQSIETLRSSLDERYREGYDNGYEDAKADYGHADDDTVNYAWIEKEPDDYSVDTTLVYITDAGSKYHQFWCSYLRSSSNEVCLSDALSMGYDACSRCW